MEKVVMEGGKCTTGEGERGRVRVVVVVVRMLCSALCWSVSVLVSYDCI